MENNEFDIRLEYEKLKTECNLPEYEKLSEDFDIDKSIDKKSIFLIREIRRVITERISAYLQLFETLINPNSPPIFVFSILRNISSSDKEAIKEIYKKLSRIQVKTMKLDVIYKKEEEINFINKTFNTWQKLKPMIYKLTENFETNFENDNSSKKGSYFG